MATVSMQKQYKSGGKRQTVSIQGAKLLAVYGLCMTPGERLRLARERAGWSQPTLAKKLGIPQPTISKMEADEMPGRPHLDKLAELLNVDKAWLTVGDNPPPWASAPTPLHNRVTSHADRYATAAHGLELIGVVKAGDGDIGEFEENPPQPFPLPESWRAVQVMGMSAYPVCYPKQFILIDLNRGTRPEIMTDKERTDLHDNLVLIEVSGIATDDEPQPQPLAYLKRFCKADDAPGGYVLASIDSGRSSPYIKPERVLDIVPVVGVIFEDPRFPRVKKWHNKTVVVQVEI